MRILQLYHHFKDINHKPEDGEKKQNKVIINVTGTRCIFFMAA